MFKDVLKVRRKMGEEKKNRNVNSRLFHDSERAG